jgi:hypothetical protein
MNQKYIHNKTKEVVTIVNSDEGYHYLSTNKQILKDLFVATYTPITEDAPIVENSSYQQPKSNNDLVDPNAFFNASLNSTNIVEQLKTLPDGAGVLEGAATRKVVEREKSVQTILGYEQEEAIKADLLKDQEKQKVAEKYNLNVNKTTNNKVIDDGLDSYVDDEIALNGANSPNIKNIPQTQQIQNTQKKNINSIFSSFKRNFKVKINLTFDDKIANPEFVKLITQNMEQDDIIQYYTDELVNSIYEDIENIKKVIYTQYDIIINGEKKKSKISKPKIKKEKSVENIEIPEKIETSEDKKETE